ncbi:polysaccharide deacetylase family protein [Mucilaginibacter agri]|uniref:Polysaccharide deacetylase family protein n=1 Tax=Mucilaginibacter agri TaxID=2695265 RepID=A0A965ZH69_9SPHI|nr:polysaccharide deacetylase family protein [Mucilaginibacter agri]NCD71014.1 polysaccharide deacetylase family protein [Mucilaginibacter agri]
MKFKHILSGLLLFVTFTANAQNTQLWNNKQCAVVLTYDDAIDIDLDNVLPALDSMNFKGTFYLIGSSPVVNNRIEEWRKAAAHGHELGNHTLYHPCDGSLPGRAFVTPATDLSKYTVARAVSEARINNTLLKAIDGKGKRTFAYPCGDTKIGDTLFYNYLKSDFAGARGVTPGLKSVNQVDLDNINCYGINGENADYMISLVKKAMETHTLLVFLFHGVGGGHPLNVGLGDHSKLLHFLKSNQKSIWVTTMVDASTYIKAHQTADQSK